VGAQTDKHRRDFASPRVAALILHTLPVKGRDEAAPQRFTVLVISAEAGIQPCEAPNKKLDPGFRRGDGVRV